MRLRSLLHFIRTHVAVKLGLFLLSVFLLIIFSIGNILYSLFLSFYVSHMTEELIQRAHSHASVLSDHLTEVTIEHIVRMEEDSLFTVVIMGPRGKILASSDQETLKYKDYLERASLDYGKDEKMLETDWHGKPYLVAQSPVFQENQKVGSVVLFGPTEPIRQAVDFLRGMLVVVGVITILIVAGILFMISRMIARPLLDMKKVTGEIAQGEYRSRLLIQGEDEVAQLANSINHMSNEIQFYQRQRNEFLADIGHELRTPLTYLKGYSEVLLRHFVTEEEKRDYLTIIHNQSQRLQRLVQDLFDLARMEKGSLSFQWQRISLEEVVTDVLTFVESSMDEKGILLEYKGPKSPIEVMGDRQRLQQVFINLLENARRYTPAGGTVFVRFEENEEAVSVIIEDTGSGIPKEELPFIMERLYRVEKSRSQETGGSGLGLAISKKIIEMHKGDIKVQSEQGKGTTFFIRIPLDVGIQGDFR